MEIEDILLSGLNWNYLFLVSSYIEVRFEAAKTGCACQVYTTAFEGRRDGPSLQEPLFLPPIRTLSCYLRPSSS